VIYLPPPSSLGSATVQPRTWQRGRKKIINLRTVMAQAVTARGGSQVAVQHRRIQAYAEYGIGPYIVSLAHHSAEYK